MTTCMNVRCSGRPEATPPPKRQNLKDPSRHAGPRRPPQTPNQSQPANDADSELRCPHFEACSGCTLDRGLATPPTLAAAEALFTSLHVGPVTGWRHRARLAVRRAPDGAPAVGLFAAGSHDVVDIPGCVVHHPDLNAAADLVRQCLVCWEVTRGEKEKVEPYEEATGAGHLRYIQVAVVDEGKRQYDGAVQMVLVWNAPGRDRAPGLREFAAAVWKAGHLGTSAGGDTRPLLHSLHVNFQPKRTNAIMGQNTELLHGSSDAWARLRVDGAAAAVPIAFDPGSFMQANPGAMEAALGAILAWIPEGTNLVDLHAGVGTIGLAAAAAGRLRALRAVEINPAAKSAFWKSWVRMKRKAADPETLPEHVNYAAAAAERAPEQWLAGADVAVVDPPRKGLEPELLAYLCDPGSPALPARLIYLSCGFPALQRDAAALTGGGGWTLRDARGFLFFPGADHIESLVVFDREQGSGRGRGGPPQPPAGN